MASPAAACPALLCCAQVASAATVEYEHLHTQEKQMDKAFKREFGNREELWEDLHEIYRWGERAEGRGEARVWYPGGAMGGPACDI